MFGGDESAELLGLQRGKVGQPLRGRPLPQCAQVTKIGIQRMRRHAALDLEMRKEVFDHCRKRRSGLSLLAPVPHGKRFNATINASPIMRRNSVPMPG